MNKRIATLWVDALKSENYKQGNGLLAQVTPAGNVKHCCLGVLCDLYFKEHPEEKESGIFVKRDHDTLGFNFDLIKYFDNSTWLPEKIKTWAEMNSSDGLIDETHKTTLARLNDTGTKFSEIALLIETYSDTL